MTRVDVLTLQLSSALSQYVRKVFQVIPGRDAEFPDEIPRGAFQISIVPVFVCLRDVILRSPKVSITADRSRAFEALETLLGFGLRGRIKIIASEELIGRDAFLGAEFLAGVLLIVI